MGAPAAHILPPAFRRCVLLVTLLGGCGERVYLGSDLLWTARHEAGDFTEWTSSGGIADARAPNAIQVSGEQAHSGRFSAKLSVATTVSGVQQSSALVRSGGLPTEAYYSAWYYLPARISVGAFWVIMKFRVRRVADDPSTGEELYDLNLRSLPAGEMSLRLYSHRPGGNIPLDIADPIVPVGRWFQVEAFYRNTADATAEITFWLDGQQVVDVVGRPAGPSTWVDWDVCSIAQNLSPIAADLYVDDVAVSRVQIGPSGMLGAP